MILVDTSVWIDHLRGVETAGTRKLEELWSMRVPAAVTSLVVQELLQGTSSDQDFEVLQSYLETQPFLEPQDPFSSYAAAARLFRECRRLGRAVRSSNDCLIAQIAIDNDVALLHSDEDFEHIARIAPLRTY